MFMAAGQQCSPLVRQLPSLELFSGEVTFAGRHQSVDCILGDAERVVGKVRHLGISLGKHPDLHEFGH